VNPGGAEAEDIALRFLLEQGLKLKERNYTCRLGEIDLILLDGATLVFVEVRMRASRSFGGAAESITGRKRLRLIATARHYLSRQSTTPACRFDVILMNHDSAIVWIKDAFCE